MCQYNKKAIDLHFPREATTSGEMPDSKCSMVPLILKLWPEKVERFGDDICFLQQLRKVCLTGREKDLSCARGDDLGCYD